MLHSVHDGVTVPTAAIQTGPNGSFAYVVGDDSRVHMRPIKIAQTENNRALIGSGLKAGERVVVAGEYLLDEGTKVQATQATGTPAGGEHGTVPLDVEADP